MDAPLEVPLNTIIEAKLLDNANKGVAHAYVEVTDPTADVMRYITDDKGSIFYLGDKEGYYIYSVPCVEINITRTLVTSVYNPQAQPTNKKLIVPLRVTQPSKANVQAISLGKPIMANVSRQKPTGEILNVTTDNLGKYEEILDIPGKYVFTISASNVKSLSAKIELSVLPAKREIVEPQVLILPLLILSAIVVAYLFRKNLLTLLAKKRFAAIKYKPQAPKVGEEVVLTILDENGKEIPNTRIIIISDKGESFETKTDEKGKVLFIPTEKGIYRISSEYLLFKEDKIEVSE